MFLARCVGGESVSANRLQDPVFVLVALEIGMQFFLPITQSDHHLLLLYHCPFKLLSFRPPFTPLKRTLIQSTGGGTPIIVRTELRHQIDAGLIQFAATSACKLLLKQQSHPLDIQKPTHRSNSGCNYNVEIYLWTEHPFSPFHHIMGILIMHQSVLKFQQIMDTTIN
jgi:hypothetical protein